MGSQTISDAETNLIRGLGRMDTMAKTATLLLAAAVLGAAGAWSPAAAQSRTRTERDARGYRTGRTEGAR